MSFGKTVTQLIYATTAVHCSTAECIMDFRRASCALALVLTRCGLTAGGVPGPFSTVCNKGCSCTHLVTASAVDSSKPAWEHMCLSELMCRCPMQL